MSIQKIAQNLFTISIAILVLIACNTNTPKSNNNPSRLVTPPTNLSQTWQTGKRLLLQSPWGGDATPFSWKADESEIAVGEGGYYYVVTTTPPKVKAAIRTAGYNQVLVEYAKTGSDFALLDEYGLQVNGTSIPNTSGYQYGNRLIDWGFDPKRLVFIRPIYLGSEVVIANTSTNEVKLLQTTTNDVQVLDYSDGDNKILTITHTATIYDADTQTATWADTNPDPTSGALSPTGDRVAIAYQGSNPRITIYDTSTGAVTREIQTDNPPRTLAWDPSGTQIGGGSYDGYSRIWNASTGTLIKTLAREYQQISKLKWSPSGAKITVASGRNLIFYDATTFKDIGRIGEVDPNGRKNNVYGLAFSTNQPTLLEVGRNNTENKLYDARTGIVEQKFSGHSDSIYGVAYNADSSRFVTGSSDGTAIIWDASTTPPTPIQTLSSHTYTVRGVAWGANTIATASWDSSAKLWKADTYEEIATIQHNDFVNAVAFNPDSTQIATGSSDRTLKISSSTDGSQIRSIAVPAAVLSLNWNSDGTQIAVGATDKNTYVFDVSTGALIKTFTGHTGAVRAVLWSKDNSALITASDDSTVKLWNASSGEEITSVKPVSGYAVFALALSPDGKTVVAGSAAGPTVAYTLE